MLADWADQAHEFDPTLRTHVEMFADHIIHKYPPETWPDECLSMDKVTADALGGDEFLKHDDELTKPILIKITKDLDFYFNGFERFSSEELVQRIREIIGEAILACINAGDVCTYDCCFKDWNLANISKVLPLSDAFLGHDSFEAIHAETDPWVAAPCTGLQGHGCPSGRFAHTCCFRNFFPLLKPAKPGYAQKINLCLQCVLPCECIPSFLPRTVSLFSCTGVRCV